MSRDICIFGSELASSADGVYIGGSATSAIRLAKSLSEMGETVHIVTMAPRDWDEKRIRRYEGPDWASTHVFDATSQHPGILDGFNLLYNGTKELIDYCRRNEIDIIHSHSGYSVLAAISILASRFTNLPVFHTQYCPIPTDPENIEQLLSSPLFARLTLNRANHIFAMTKNIKQSLQNHAIANVSFVPPVIDTNEYRPDLPAPDSVEIADDKLSVLFVGNLKPDKGVAYLVEAVGNAREAGVPLQLILTTERDFPGSEDRRRYLDNLIERFDLREDIIELGIIDDMPNVIAHSDVLVAPFRTTSGPSDYPLAVLEAMACETPVVATDIGGISELLDDNRGYLVPPEDSAAIAQALQDIHNGKSFNGNRQFINCRFAPNAVAKNVIKEYNNYV